MRPRLEIMFAVNTSAGRTSERSIAIERSTDSGVRPWPVRSITNISEIKVSINSTLGFGPSIVISLPRTKITESAKDFSITRINSSRAPVTETIGVEVGTRIQMTGQGEVGPGGGPAGDLYVELIELPHPVFQRNGDQLHATMSLPMTAAALGATMELETLDGTAPIHIKPGTQSGSTVTLRGQGMPRLRSSGRGDLVVHLEILTPSGLDKAQEDLIKQLASLRGEETPSAQLHEQSSSLFGKLKDAFTTR